MVRVRVRVDVRVRVSGIRLNTFSLNVHSGKYIRFKYLFTIVFSK